MGWSNINSEKEAASHVRDCCLRDPERKAAGRNMRRRCEGREEAREGEDQGRKNRMRGRSRRREGTRKEGQDER